MNLEVPSLSANLKLYKSATVLLRKLQNLLPKTTLITIYKAFVRPDLDSDDVLYDQDFNSFFHEKLQCSVKRLPSLNWSYSGYKKRKNLSRARFGVPPSSMFVQKTLSLLKSIKERTSSIFYQFDSSRGTLYSTRNKHNIPLLNTNFIFFKKLIFPIFFYWTEQLGFYS